MQKQGGKILNCNRGHDESKAGGTNYFNEFNQQAGSNTNGGYDNLVHIQGQISETRVNTS